LNYLVVPLGIVFTAGCKFFFSHWIPFVQEE
jgi:hypothetical protein